MSVYPDSLLKKAMYLLCIGVWPDEAKMQHDQMAKSFMVHGPLDVKTKTPTVSH